jgi:hypothetical protein
MPFKTYERFGEIDAQEIKQDLQFKREATNMKVLLFIVFLAIGTFLYIGNIIVNQFWYIEKPYAWLNRCNIQCQKVVNIHHVDQIGSCIGLTNLFNEPQQNFPVDWRLAVDDKASSLGCSGFPKTIEEIESVVQKIAEQTVQVDTKIEQKRQEVREQLSKKNERFEESMNEKTLRGYIAQSNQSTARASEMQIVMTANFWRLNPVKQEEILNTVWQKWAVIYDHRNTTETTVTIYDTENILKGTKTSLTDKAF